MMGPGPAVFAVHPVSGVAVVYQSFPVASVTSERLEAAARQLASVAQRWRQGEFAAARESGTRAPKGQPHGDIVADLA